MMPLEKVDISWKAAQQMMTPPAKFIETMMGFKQRIDDGIVPKSNFPNIQDMLKEECFDFDIMRKKSSAAAGITDFIININIYNDINENVEPMRLGALNATAELEQMIASKDAALAAKKLAVEEAAIQFALEKGTPLPSQWQQPQRQQRLEALSSEELSPRGQTPLWR
jgi:dynein heavy chain